MGAQDNKRKSTTVALPAGRKIPKNPPMFFSDTTKDHSLACAIPSIGIFQLMKPFFASEKQMTKRAPKAVTTTALISN